MASKLSRFRRHRFVQCSGQHGELVGKSRVLDFVPGNVFFGNVFPPSAYEEGRRLAIDEDTSLSALVSELLEERLKQRALKQPKTWMEALRHDED